MKDRTIIDVQYRHDVFDFDLPDWVVIYQVSKTIFYHVFKELEIKGKIETIENYEYNVEVINFNKDTKIADGRKFIWKEEL